MLSFLFILLLIFYPLLSIYPTQTVPYSSIPLTLMPDHDQQRCYRHAPTVKPEAANAVVSS